MHAGYPVPAGDESASCTCTRRCMRIWARSIGSDRARNSIEYLRALVRAGLGKRLMFGSDQMVWPEGIGRAIEGIESAPAS